MGVTQITDSEPHVELGVAPHAGPSLFAPERRAAIVGLASAQGRVTVTELAEQFAVAPETIRRDLDALERTGRIHRVHGGAIPPDRHGSRESPVGDRRASRAPEKARIARAALAHLPRPHGSMLLDGGTTTAALAAALLRAAQDDPAAAPLTVVTNSPAAGVTLSQAPRHDVLVLGGRLRAVTETVVGAPTLEHLASLNADVAFLGANGLSPDLGLTTPDADEAAVKRLMVSRSRRVVLLADSSKVGRRHLCSFAALEDVDVLITDAAPPQPLSAALDRAQIEVVVA